MIAQDWLPRLTKDTHETSLHAWSVGCSSGEEAYTLLVTMHHIASDGWSKEIFLRELGALYTAYSRGEADPLPALPVSTGAGCA